MFLDENWFILYNISYVVFMYLEILIQIITMFENINNDLSRSGYINLIYQRGCSREFDKLVSKLLII